MMDEKMRKAYEAWWEKQRNDALPPTDYEIIEWTLNYLRSQQEPVAFAKDGALFWHGAYKHGVSCDLYAAPQPAAAGEEIMVNAAHDVYTLQLQPSGLSSGPRFVVHVPAPEQAVPQGWVLVPKKPTLEMCRAVREETRFCDPVAIYQKMLAAAPPSAPHPAITHCDNCGGDWLDNGLNPVGCPYCKRFTSVPVAAVVREHDGRAFAVLRPAGENLPDGTELYAAQPEPITPPQPSLMDGATYRCRKCGEQNEIMLNSARIVTRLRDGSPRDPRDIESDPAGTLIHDPAKPLHAAPVAAQPECCGNPAQCWEPCGELGKSAEHAAVAPDEELRRDAERYRWLRNHYGLSSLHIADRYLMEVRTVKYSGAAQGLDVTIDAAIAAEKREG